MPAEFTRLEFVPVCLHRGNSVLAAKYFAAEHEGQRDPIVQPHRPLDGNQDVLAGC
jgi:hypothetical protein